MKNIAAWCSLKRCSFRWSGQPSDPWIQLQEWDATTKVRSSNWNSFRTSADTSLLVFTKEIFLAQYQTKLPFFKFFWRHLLSSKMKQTATFFFKTKCIATISQKYNSKRSKISPFHFWMSMLKKLVQSYSPEYISETNFQWPLEKLGFL